MKKSEVKVILKQQASAWGEVAAEVAAEYEKLVNIKSISQRTLRLLLSLRAKARRLKTQLEAEVEKLETKV